jgi:hypothetical protein
MGKYFIDDCVEAHGTRFPSLSFPIIWQFAPCLLFSAL